MTFTLFVLVFLVELCDAGSQILFKQTVNRFEVDAFHSVPQRLTFFLALLKKPGMWCGFLLVACGLLLWFTVLAQADLSLVFPFSSIQYLLILAASYLFLRERGNWRRLVGTCCIAAGIVCVALS